MPYRKLTLLLSLPEVIRLPRSPVRLDSRDRGDRKIQKGEERQEAREESKDEPSSR